MKKILLVFSFLLILIPFFTYAVVPKDQYYYVSDYAKILENETIDYIIDNSSFLKEQTKVEYYVVTIDKLNGEDVDTYINSLYDEFCSNDTGIIILFVKRERMIKVVVGSRLSSFLSDETIVETIQSYFMPFFKNEEWDLGIQNGYTAFYKIICDYYHIDSSSLSLLDGNDILTKYKTLFLLFITWVGLTITYVCCIYFLKIYKGSYTSKMDDFIFIFMFFTNIGLLFLTHWIDSHFIWILFLLEIICFIFIYVSLYQASKKRKIRRRKRKK